MESTKYFEQIHAAYMRDLTRKISDADLIYIDCCSLMDPYMPELAEDLVPILASQKKKLIIIENVMNELKKHVSQINIDMTEFARKANAYKGLYVLEKIMELDAVRGYSVLSFQGVPDEVKYVHADAAFETIISAKSIRQTVLVITQDNSLNESLRNLNKSKATNRKAISVYAISHERSTCGQLEEIGQSPKRSFAGNTSTSADAKKTVKIGTDKKSDTKQQKKVVASEPADTKSKKKTKAAQTVTEISTATPIVPAQTLAQPPVVPTPTTPIIPQQPVVPTQAGVTAPQSPVVPAIPQSPVVPTQTEAVAAEDKASSTDQFGERGPLPFRIAGPGNMSTGTQSGGSGILKGSDASAYMMGGELYVPSDYSEIAKLTTSAIVKVYMTDSVRAIRSQAFADCTTLNQVKLSENLEVIDDSAFSGCKALRAIDIPAKVKSIGSSAFRDCSALSTVNLGSGLTEIGNAAFAYCESLTTVRIPSGVKTINAMVFKGCTSLTGVHISDGTKIICASAFGNCTSLVSVTIPRSVEDIAGTAFFNCPNLVIYCYRDSYAHAFAAEHNLKHQLMA